MEMHQVGYFLAAAVERSFTGAAERCDVSATELTRGINQLEEELGGNLFRREQSLLHLTEFGELMQRRMKQIHDSAVANRLLASSIKSREVGSLRLALSHSVAFGLLTPLSASSTDCLPVSDQRSCGDLDSQHDLILLVEAGLGAAIVPGSMSIPRTLARTLVDGIELRRTVYMYGLAGHSRSAGASAIFMMVRAADWSRYEN